MIPHEDEPEDDSLGVEPSEEDEVQKALKTLETRITKILKHANTEQGLYAIDLIESLHRVLGHVISWGMVEAEDDTEEDDSEDESEVEPKDDGVFTPDWTPASDLNKDDDDTDIDDQGDPRKPCLV